MKEGATGIIDRVKNFRVENLLRKKSKGITRETFDILAVEVLPTLYRKLDWLERTALQNPPTIDNQNVKQKFFIAVKDKEKFKIYFYKTLIDKSLHISDIGTAEKERRTLIFRETTLESASRVNGSGRKQIKFTFKEQSEFLTAVRDAKIEPISTVELSKKSVS